MSDTITVLHRCDPNDTPVTLCVNGKVATISNNMETAIPAYFHDAAINCGFPIEILGAGEAPADDEDAPTPEPVAPVADEGAGAAGEDGGTGLSGEGFNADAIIDGNVTTVAGRLAALDADQLAAVQAAELDREVPRAGVKAAIEAALKAKEVPAA